MVRCSHEAKHGPCRQPHRAPLCRSLWLELSPLTFPCSLSLILQFSAYTSQPRRSPPHTPAQASLLSVLSGGPVHFLGSTYGSSKLNEGLYGRELVSCLSVLLRAATMSVVLMSRSANPSCLSATHRTGQLHALSFVKESDGHTCQHQQQVALPGPCHRHTYKHREIVVRFQTTEIKRISQPRLLHHSP